MLKFGVNSSAECAVMKPKWKEVERRFQWMKAEFYDFEKDSKIVDTYKIKKNYLPLTIFIDQKNNEMTRVYGDINVDRLSELIFELKDQEDGISEKKDLSNSPPKGFFARIFGK